MTDKSLDLLVRSWAFAVEFQTRSYAYEAFIRMGDFIQGHAELKDSLLSHDSPLVRQVAKEIEDAGGLSYHFFQDLWQEASADVIASAKSRRNILPCSEARESG